MEIKIEKISPCERIVNVNIQASEINEKINSLYLSYQKTIKIDGFRKGNVPLAIIKNKYGDVIKEEAINASIRESYMEILNKEKIIPVSEAVLKETKFSEEERLSFSLSFEVMPEIKLKNYKEIKVTCEKIEVTQQEKENTIAKLRNAKAIYVPAIGHSAHEEDMVVVDYEILQQEKGIYRKNKVSSYSILMDDNRLLPEIKNALLNSMPGDNRKVAVRYPQDHEDQKLRGQTVEYSFTIQEVKTKKLPDVNDEFAKEFGFKSYNALENEITEKIKKDKERQIKNKTEMQIINSLIENNAFTPPKSLVYAYLEPLLRETKNDTTELQGKEEEIKKALEEIATWKAKREILLNTIANIENITLSEKEIKTKLSATEESKKLDYEQLVNKLKQKKIYGLILEELRMEKVLEFLEKNATITYTKEKPQDK